jgi:hypothetical protein
MPFIKAYLNTIVIIITIIGGIAGAGTWANINLANKADIEDMQRDIANTRLRGEFDSVEMQLSFNDYRVSEIVKDIRLANPDQATVSIDDADIDTKRIYTQILDNSKKLSDKRMELLTSGALDD